MRTVFNITKNIVMSFWYLYLTIFFALFVLPVTYAVWKNRHPHGTLEQYLEGR